MFTTAENEPDVMILASQSELKHLILVFQVCYSLHDYETRDHEIKALVKCMEGTGMKNATILTCNENGTEERNGLRIDIKPVWRFLLEEYKDPPTSCGNN